MFTAIILAAGLSERMGALKPFLKLDDKTFLEVIIDNLSAFKPEQIIVILNPQNKILIDQINSSKLTICINDQPQLGQFSSLKIAIENINNKNLPFLMCLADHPFVKKETYKKILDASQNKTEYVIIPSFEGRKGHPVLFSSNFINNIKSADNSITTKDIINDKKEKVMILNVYDSGILMDTDTPEDFQKFKDVLKN